MGGMWRSGRERRVFKRWLPGRASEVNNNITANY